MSEIFIVTVGESGEEFDSVMLTASSARMGAIRVHFLPRIMPLALIVVGTSARAKDTYEILAPGLRGETKVVYSPFCGTSDTPQNNGSILLASGRLVARADYWGLDNPAFDAWKFLEGLPHHTLLCADKELVELLKPEFKVKHAYLYRLFATARIVQKVFTNDEARILEVY